MTNHVSVQEKRFAAVLLWVNSQFEAKVQIESLHHRWKRFVLPHTDDAPEQRFFVIDSGHHRGGLKKCVAIFRLADHSIDRAAMFALKHEPCVAEGN